MKASTSPRLSETKNFLGRSGSGAGIIRAAPIGTSFGAVYSARAGLESRSTLTVLTGWGAAGGGGATEDMGATHRWAPSKHLHSDSIDNHGSIREPFDVHGEGCRGSGAAKAAQPSLCGIPRRFPGDSADLGGGGSRDTGRGTTAPSRKKS